MGTEKVDEEKLFTECKEFVEDVFGWKTLIFLPQNTSWKVFIMITVAISFVITTTKVFYRNSNTFFSILEVLCDSLYFVDVLCATLNFGLNNTRKLRHGKKRHIIFLFVDYISLIPLNLLYEYLIYKLGEKPSDLNYILRANALLRSYLLPKGFSEIKQDACKILTYFFMAFMEIFVYFLLIMHFFGCLIFLYYDEELKKKCLDQFSYCIAENDLVSVSLLDHNYINPVTNIPVKSYSILVNVELLLGFIFTYGFVTPLIIYVYLTFLRIFFEYSNKWKQLSLWIKNKIGDKDLKKNITNYIQYTWAYGRDDNVPEILNILPLSFRKSIFCDIHWEALGHSDFLKSLSVGCKRSLALHMKTEFVLPKTIIFQKQQKKTSFMYLESGLLQVMADENNDSPLLNLSEGTVLGEMTLFFQVESKAVLRTGKFSVIHYLHFTDLFRVLIHYPQDRKKLHYKMHLRMKIAKAVDKANTEIYPHFLERKDYDLSRTGTVKWVKQQYRALIRLEKAEYLGRQVESVENIENYKRHVRSLEVQLNHTSVYLPLLCIKDEVDKGYDAVCLKDTFPWFVDPQSSFLTLWRVLINALSLLVVVLYPAFIGWFPKLPAWFYNITILINFMYILDVLIQFVTAVKVKSVLVTKLSTVVKSRCTTFIFYLDVLAALPLYLLQYLYKDLQKPFKLNLLISNTLLKSYKLLPVINKLSYNPKPGIFYRATIKYFLIMYFSVYWSAALFNLTGVECIFYECGNRDWFSDSQIKKAENYKTIVSIFVSLYLVLDIPNKNVTVDEFPSYFLYFGFYIISNFLYYAWQGECIACYVLENSNNLQYRSFTQEVLEFLNQSKTAGMVKQRVLSSLEFEWLYDKGYYFMQKRRILEDISVELQDEIYRKYVLPVMQKSQLFSLESDEFLVELSGKARRLAMPAKSLLLTFGTQTTSLYIVSKGYVQVNSFIVGDSHLNISTPLILKSGDAFPVLVAFSQLPACVTALTLTDCELLAWNLEDILSTMTSYKVFPDLVEALKATDLTPMVSAKIGLSRIREVFKFDKESYRAVFARLKCLGTLLRLVSKKTGIDSKDTSYVFWEFIRCGLILLNLILWPIVFGCFSKSKYKETLMYVLVIFDILSSLIDFYLRLHIGYYNHLGIYVSHPLATMSRYLTSSFATDTIAFAPNCHVLYMLATKKLNYSLATVITHMLLRSISLYRIIGLINYVYNDFKKYANFVKLFKWILLFLLALHYYINIMVYFYVKTDREPIFTLSFKNKIPEEPEEFYFSELTVLVSGLLNSPVIFKAYNVYTLACIIILGTLSVLIQTVLFSVLTLNIAGLSENFTIYQYYLRSFVRYLNEEKVDDNISAEAIKYFKFKWEEHKGVDIYKVFSRFPQTLHEDILFPLFKNTFGAVKCLSSANEAFYRALSRNVQSLHLMKASTIIFKEQVQDEIFFLHKGKCFVEEVSKTLGKGSVMGDIRRDGIMKHTIVALTPVSLLTIPSTLFFLIMSNFYNTKRAYELEVAKADNFIESGYFDQRKDISVNIEVLEEKEKENESEFKPVNYGMEDPVKRPFKKKKVQLQLRPDSLTITIFNFLFFLDAYVTSIVVPIFIGTTLLSWWSLTIIYVLDVFWVIKIILTVRTGLLDPKTGNYTFKRKVLALNYLRKFNGMILHVLSVLPIELIVVAYYGKTVASKHCVVMFYCYFNRLLRIPYIHYYVQSKMKELLANVYLKLLNISVFGIAFINLFVSLNMILRHDDYNCNPNCIWGGLRSQVDNVIRSYLFVLNEYVGGGLSIYAPDNPLEICFHLLIELWAILSKAVVVNQVLVIIYVTQYTKSNKLLRLQELERYLSIRNVSPHLLLKMEKYCTNLLNSYKEGAHPAFLKEVPPFIRLKIMESLYLHHLQECYIFQNVEEIFLKQLAMRLERLIFFPGDYIIEKGDVDQNMYFIHKGEVKCVELDQAYPILERTVDLFVTGESFGVMQGIFFSCPHSNTYRAKVLTHILVLNYNRWADLRSAFPEITNRIYKRFQQTGVTKIK